LQKERWVMEKKYILKKHRKNMLWSKSKEKKRKERMTPCKIKARGNSQSKECLENTKLFHTLAHLNQVAWLVSSWIRSWAQQYHVAQVSLILILPKAP
jgi:hypothetical protein